MPAFAPSWDLLVCSIEHRTAQLTELLDTLQEQIAPGVGVRVFRDNLQTGYGAKCQALLDSSEADYVSFIDDDDMVVADFIPTVLLALRQRPDYVGLRVRYTEDGEPQVPVIHSLEHHGWVNTSEGLYRDIVHFNPIRRELALQSRWEGGNGADGMWAGRLRELGIVKHEVFIARELYEYRHTTHDTFLAPREPVPQPIPRPEFGFVTWL